ncbi:hypothetical protein F751_4467 [Auxenochlorella protothecoides]|uniref:Uncharacterized protein n=1 Tax=Auxenochlorella protothecoides TaxID=3075 RepID=A0A087SN93_AUXPR|nr:hypothetical protein F751_4467 [Auxenochlorella protothecoides]KFM27197.1 hypothetical protein F751_4467 [Auxenochlorella protothecoides]
MEKGAGPRRRPCGAPTRPGGTCGCAGGGVCHRRRGAGGGQPACPCAPAAARVLRRHLSGSDRPQGCQTATLCQGWGGMSCSCQPSRRTPRHPPSFPQPTGILFTYAPFWSGFVCCTPSCVRQGPTDEKRQGGGVLQQLEHGTAHLHGFRNSEGPSTPCDARACEAGTGHAVAVVSVRACCPRRKRALREMERIMWMP